MEMKLLELADEAGVPARTVRLYIARGLLPGPLRAGRDAAYGEEHLVRLRQIRELQRQGLTLAEIGRRLAGAGEPDDVAGPVAWLSYTVAPDVAVLVRAEVAPWRRRRLQRAIRAMAAVLDETTGEDETC